MERGREESLPSPPGPARCRRQTPADPPLSVSASASRCPCALQRGATTPLSQGEKQKESPLPPAPVGGDSPMRYRQHREDQQSDQSLTSAEWSRRRQPAASVAVKSQNHADQNFVSIKTQNTGQRRRNADEHGSASRSPSSPFARSLPLPPRA